MPADPCISEVVVEGLHGQFDLSIQLLPGLNVVYGKNGRGKTTLLHLLANLIELDFQRFTYLQFHKISVRTSRDDLIELQKDEPGGPPKVSLNGSSTSFAINNSSLSEVEVASLREALGPRPTYLPAFRSILERTRSDSAPYYRPAERREPEFEEIAQRELASLRELYSKGAGSSSAMLARQAQEEATSIAEKTMLCRQWFGRFVPVVRYPSVADVEDSLSEEWRRAALEITGREQRMLEETFVKIFRIISGLEETPTVESNENLLASISSLLMEQESQIANTESRAIYDRLLMSARSLGANTAPLRGIDKSLLEIYRQVLDARNTERRTAFQKSRDFEASINRFLDSKTLRIGNTHARPRARSAVAVTTTGGQSYGLSALSSGERQILTMLYSASRPRFLSGIFLIDEPELSLHIDWQRIILRELKNQSPDRQLIACTHSPEVGADHVLENQDFEPRNTSQRQDSLFSDEEP
jgi:ABC-type lipoprotein export system ATPase subunit